MSKYAIVIHGPQGCGKTLSAEALAKHFGCRKIIDSPRVLDEAVEGTLYLCQSPLEIPAGVSALVLSFDDAMHEAGVAFDSMLACA